MQHHYRILAQHGQRRNIKYKIKYVLLALVVITLH